MIKSSTTLERAKNVKMQQILMHSNEQTQFNVLFDFNAFSFI